MNHRAHKIAGTCAGIITATALYSKDIQSGNTLIAVAPMMIGGYIGGLLPDIDHPKSRLGRIFFPIAWVINKLFGHRGATHSLLALILVSILILIPTFSMTGMVAFLYAQFAIGISVGFASHLLLDMSTVSGIPLLYPFIRKSFNVANLKTGKHDALVSILVIVLTATTIYFYV